MSAHVPLRNCSAENEESNHVDSIFKFAQDAGKATGIVTNTRVTHATPAGLCAHNTIFQNLRPLKMIKQLPTQNLLLGTGKTIHRHLKAARIWHFS